MKRHPESGMTLIEIIAAMTIISIMGIMLAQNLSQPLNQYDEMKDQGIVFDSANKALSQIQQSINLALPNSVTFLDSNTIEFVPIVDSGRYREKFDTHNGIAQVDLLGGLLPIAIGDSTIGDPLDLFNLLDDSFETIGRLSALPEEIVYDEDSPEEPYYLVLFNQPKSDSPNVYEPITLTTLGINYANPDSSRAIISRFHRACGDHPDKETPDQGDRFADFAIDAEGEQPSCIEYTPLKLFQGHEGINLDLGILSLGGQPNRFYTVRYAERYACETVGEELHLVKYTDYPIKLNATQADLDTGIKSTVLKELESCEFEYTQASSLLTLRFSLKNDGNTLQFFNQMYVLN